VSNLLVQVPNVRFYPLALVALRGRTARAGRNRFLRDRVNELPAGRDTWPAAEVERVGSKVTLSFCDYCRASLTAPRYRSPRLSWIAERGERLALGLLLSLHPGAGASAAPTARLPPGPTAARREANRRLEKR
jgi:hypothetical protein